MNPSAELGMAEDDLRTCQVALASALKHLAIAHAAADGTPGPKEGGRA